MFDDFCKTTVEIINNNGYAFEIHPVKTEDDYILELHRIPLSKSGQKPTRNHPVFIHHGILGSSADWVLGGANVSLPMQLADVGYDVWLANCRGNTYSKKHKTMTYKDKAFGNFSLNEIGIYDLPAAIDHILMITDTPQVHYIGYSMGTTLFYIMASERPEYQPKIRSQVSLAPVAYLYNTKSMLKHFTSTAKLINHAKNGLIFNANLMQTLFANTMRSMTQRLLVQKRLLFNICGNDPKFFNSDLLPLIFGHLPAGTSSKLVEHFAQLIKKENFAQYDYGPELNMKYYNSAMPPSYKLHSIQVPITLIFGHQDILADIKDVMKLKDQLPKIMNAFPAKNPYCNHLDFLWSLTVNEDINDPIKQILETTDDRNWVYTGPSPAITNEIPKVGFRKMFETKTNLLSRLISRKVPNFEGDLGQFEDNLDGIIENTMPQFVHEKDLTVFQQEYANQKTLFGKLIEFLKSAEAKNGQDDTNTKLETLNKIVYFLKHHH